MYCYSPEMSAVVDLSKERIDRWNSDHLPIFEVSTCTVIAQKCPGVTVTVVDLSKERIDQWNSDHLPIFEVSTCTVIAQKCPL